MADQHMPVLSLVVPVYGVEAFVGDCMTSIVNADGFRELCELIIVDDGSIDGSMAIVERVCAQLQNVVILRQPNAGLGAARNAGLARARGRYVWFVDSDDQICSGAISLLARRIDKHEPEVIAFEFETMGGTLERPHYAAPFERTLSPVSFMMSGRPPSPVQFYVFARALLERAGLRFETGIYHEDALFTPLALVEAKSLIRTRETCYRYRLHTNSIMSAGRPEKHLADILFVAEALGARAAAAAADGEVCRALGREVGFSLAAVRYYAGRTTRLDRLRIAPLHRLLTAGKRWWRYFAPAELINYLRLLGAVAFKDGWTRSQ